MILDAETYWDDEYTLSKLSLEAYIRDPRFLVHGWGIKPVGQPGTWMSHEEFTSWAKTVDWGKTTIIGHNLHFDGAILAWHYGIVPMRYADTLGMSRALYPCELSHSLAKMGVLIKAGKLKNPAALLAAKGKRKLTPVEYAALGAYCLDDCALTDELYCHGRDQMPRLEWKLLDQTIRMFTQPVMRMDIPRLEVFLDRHRAEIQRLISEAHSDRAVLQSNKKFAEALKTLGVSPPMKTSKTTNRLTFAFAKTDRELVALLNHDNECVQALVAARLGTKSTLVETRALRFLETGRQGTVPIQINYWGAKVTGRDSGAGGANFQNLPRRGAGKELRNCLIAPKGKAVVVGDSSNIELRLAMRLSKQRDALEKIRRGVDLYCDFATDVYGRVITQEDKEERFVGKVGMLSLQYGVGPTRFQDALLQGNVRMHVRDVERIVDLYRKKHAQVVRLWWYFSEVLQAIVNRQLLHPVDPDGIFVTVFDGFAIPGHLGIHYKGLRFNEASDNFEYQSGAEWVKLYGAKCFENLCQHAARHTIMYQAALFNTRYPVVNRVHDEIMSCVPVRDAEECGKFLLQCLKTPPPWCPDLPLDGEVHVGNSYGEAKP